MDTTGTLLTARFVRIHGSKLFLLAPDAWRFKMDRFGGLLLIGSIIILLTLKAIFIRPIRVFGTRTLAGFGQKRQTSLIPA